jgi:transglutaminase/protease-like cytokinesis protein 3
MAFKALADELGLNTRVVLGELNGMVHAWNVVCLDGEEYHIDTAMGALHGMDNVFMRTYSDFIEMGYSWE